MALPNDRLCFYCKQSFHPSAFHSHLRECNARTNRNKTSHHSNSNNNNNYNYNNNNNCNSNNNNNNNNNFNNKQSSWTCPQCTYGNDASTNACIICQCSKPTPQISNNNSQNNNWKCMKCTFVNNDTTTSCAMCLNTRPGYKSNQTNNNNDEASLKFLEQFLCILCKKNQGYDLTCNHKICIECANEYIINNNSILCPYPNGCKNNGIISDYIIKECHFNKEQQNKCEQMKKEYIISCDPTLKMCPKCKEVYSIEDGDMKSIDQNEKGPDGKRLSNIHLKHKATHRFRCEKEQCKTIFCSGCQSVPYHIGYTCAEYKAYKHSAKCRFCEVSLNSNNLAPKDYTLKSGLNNVCNSKECMSKRDISCDLKHNCGHNCIGLRGYKCIDCLNEKCVGKGADINDGDYCNICWVEPLYASPCIQLQCGHYFHFQCVKNKIDKKWPAARITFGFLNCPLCKKEMYHPALNNITKEYYELKNKIQRDAIERVKIEHLENDERLKDKSSAYYNNLPKYAMDRLAFYMCSKCKKPYFGGMKACEEAGLEQEENYKSEHLVCGSCASGPNAKSCKIHGKKYITYKCKFCCNVSSWFCWGNTHFCDKCHKKQEGGDYLNRKPISELPKCPGKDKCPLGIEHPPNGTAEFSLGCVVCLRK